MKKIFMLAALYLSFAQNSFAQCTGQILQQGPITVCQDDSIGLYATPGGDNYEWVVNGVTVQNGTSDAWVVTTGTPNVYTAVVNITFGTCTSTSSAVTVTVDPAPATPVPILQGVACQGGMISVTTNPVVGATYQWVSPCLTTSNMQTWTIQNPPLCMAGTFTLTVTSNGCTSDEAYLNVNLLPQPAPPTVISPVTLCQYSMSGPLQAPGSNILWYNVQVGGNPMFTAPVPNTVTPGVVTYYATQTINDCESLHEPIDVIITPNCDSVWPGDVNYDLIADNNDVLDLGLYNGETGMTRNGASLTWVEQICSNWGTAQLNGEDMKHADCDGNGLVDAAIDVDAVNMNYGMVHLKGPHLPQAKSAAFPDLYFDLTGITFTAGTTVSLPIKLGTSSMPMSNILGIAAKVKVQNVTLNNAPTINNSPSWIGNGSNVLNFQKEVSSNQTDWTLVRTNHTNVSGDGSIATLTMDIPAGSSGDAILYFDDVRIINSAGQEITDYNVVDDTATIVPLNINNATTLENKIAVVPNPSEGQAELRISSIEKGDLHITITDVTGKEVWSRKTTVIKGIQSISLPATLARGVYNVTVRSSEQNIISIRWLNNK